MINRQAQRIIPFHLATERTTIGANATATMTIQVPGDADFEARYINGSFTSTTAVMLVRDSGTRMEINNRPVYVALMTGVGQLPYVIPAPLLLVRNSNIEVVVQDLSGQSNVVQVVFCGFLIYPGPVGQV